MNIDAIQPTKRTVKTQAVKLCRDSRECTSEKSVSIIEEELAFNENVNEKTTATVAACIVNIMAKGICVSISVTVGRRCDEGGCRCKVH